MTGEVGGGTLQSQRRAEVQDGNPSVERTRDTSCLQGTGKLITTLTTETQEGGEIRVPGQGGIEDSRTNNLKP